MGAAADAGAVTALDERDARALTEKMTVIQEAPDLFNVTTQSGKSYTVDVQTGACDCADAFYNGAVCKHRRRVAFATGEREIPAWVDDSAVDPLLGHHCDSEEQR